MFKLSFKSLLLLLGIAAAPSLAEDLADPVQAIWKPQRIEFNYQSFTTFYSCDGLESRVKRLLREVGARDDLKVRVTGCEGMNRPTRMPFVRIDMTSPVEATPQALEEINKDKTKRELSARVRGERAEELTAQFPAHWRKVDLSAGKLDIDPGECELIDELNKKVFSKLAIKVTRDDISCVPNQRSIGQPKLEIEALTAAPKPDDAKS